MKKIKKEIGITLIALVITIVILIILASVGITMSLSNNGLFKRTKLAKNEYLNAQDYEKNEFNDIEDKIEAIMGGRGNLNVSDCTIDISRDGIVSVSGVSKLKSFFIIVNDKWFDTTKNSTFKLEGIPTKATVNVYVIAIDEDSNLYKSNTKTYTSNELILYDNGVDNTEVTGGWQGYNDRNAGYDLTSYNYLYIVSTSNLFIGANVCTKNAINVTGYTKLKALVTYTKYHSQGNFSLGIKPTTISAINTTPFDDTDYRSDYILESSGENEMIEVDITEATGNWYAGIAGGGYNIQIHKMWLE